MQVPNLEISKQIYAEFKFWGPMVSGLWIIFKSINWVKDIKDNHLTHIQQGINEFNTKLDTALATQTKEIVSATSNNTSEVRGLRSDVQGLTTVLLARK